MHGGANSAIAKAACERQPRTPHRDKLLLHQFYDRVVAGTYPSNGFDSCRASPRHHGHYGPHGLGHDINYADTQLDRERRRRNYWRGALPRAAED